MAAGSSDAAAPSAAVAGAGAPAVTALLPLPGVPAPLEAILGMGTLFPGMIPLFPLEVIHNLLRENAALKAQVERLEAELERVSTENEALTRQLRVREVEAGELKASLSTATAQGERGVGGRQVERLRAELERVNTENEALKKQLGVREVEAGELEASLGTATAKANHEQRLRLATEVSAHMMRVATQSLLETVAGTKRKREPTDTGVGSTTAAARDRGRQGAASLAFMPAVTEAAAPAPESTQKVDTGLG